ncbi:hypothetical protein C1645_822472 [Glomus cerebriforme]|uniref:Serine-threonine/tyrosine-protein kinase catalytic domain-containing protein n=1 Tax=Glomus cerebriforme TaxID=658196 RepID=A0A397T1F0_9GLOM|nr:hypothetical protein C1645_822472 [Glomus cerebriforme]
MKCYILWMIIGNPTKLSVFSPNNRKIQVNFIKEFITLYPHQLNYYIKIPFSLSEGYTIFVHAYHSSTNYEPNNLIKLVKWSYNCLDFQISSDKVINIDLNICIMFTDSKNLSIDNNKEREYPLIEKGFKNTTEWIKNALKHKRVRLIPYKYGFGSTKVLFWTKINNYVIYQITNEYLLIIQYADDFGITTIQSIQNSINYIRSSALIAYLEPKRILDPNFPYTKSPDIYSFGVLMWEISSGCSPFETSDNNIVAISISLGARKNTIPNTPYDYEELYKSYWSRNEKIDDFIQKMQLKTDSPNDKIFEWIPYNQFINNALLIFAYKKVLI